MEMLLQMLGSLIERIKATRPTIETVEWYLVNNLLQLKEVAERSPTQHDFENAKRVLSSFIIDSMDWDDPLFKEATTITEQAKRVNI